MNSFSFRSYLFSVSLILISGSVSAAIFSGKDSATTDTVFIIRKIVIEGNKSTKQSIINRELVFSEGDTIKASDLKMAIIRTRENILNTNIFHFVEISTTYETPEKINLKIHVTERWYIWPFPIFELADRNFNEWWATKDLHRTNYGFFLLRDNFRGRNEQVQLLFRTGYAQKMGIVYTVPYLSKQKKGGLSAGISYLRYHEIVYKTVNNKLVFYKDRDNFMRKELSTSATYRYRQGLYGTHYINAEYHFIRIGDTIPVLNRDYFLDGSVNQQYIGLSYKYKYEGRDLTAYPLKGNYFDVEIGNKWINPGGDEKNISYLISTYRQYVPIYKRFYFAASLKGKISGSATQPYFNEIGLGYGNDLVRGYEQYVIDGQHFLLFRSNFKYNIIPTKILKLENFPFEKFNTIPVALFFNVFSDMGYVWNVQDHGGLGKWTSGTKIYPTAITTPVVNPLDNSFLMGYGIGLDYVTYYNVIFRIEYSANLKFERDFRLAFTIPI